MEWIYVENELPPKKGDVPPICLVSAKDTTGRCYITYAAYYEDKKKWIDVELNVHNVYAWCIPTPALERT